MIGWLVNSYLQRMYREEAVAKFEVMLSRHLPGGTEKNHKNQIIHQVKILTQEFQIM
jgi:hypothetical protein